MKTYREVMREHRIRFSQQMLDRWEKREEIKMVDYVSKRVIFCFSLGIIFVLLLKS